MGRTKIKWNFERVFDVMKPAYQSLQYHESNNIQFSSTKTGINHTRKRPTD